MSFGNQPFKFLDEGVNAPLRTLNQTQTIERPQFAIAPAPNPFAAGKDPIASAFPITNDAAKATVAKISPTKSLTGAWSNDDASANLNKTKTISDAARTDSGTVTANATQNAISDLFSDSAVSAKPNVLDQFSSFNYAISLYMVSQEDLAALVDSGSLDIIPNNRLLIQSGGIPAANRNEYFTLDYFIQSLSIEHVMPCNNGGGAIGSGQFHMSIIEPYGITLPKNLANASKLLNGDSANADYIGLKQHFLIVIRFYGYDEHGNEIKGGNSFASSGTNSIVTKFYPVIVNNFKYRVANKMVEYEIDFTPQKLEAASSTRATLPFDFESTAQTVKEVLAGNGSSGGGTTSKKDGGRDSKTATTDAPKKNASEGANKRQSLFETLNAQQEKLVKDGLYEVADKYIIEFTNDAIASASVTIKGGELKMSDMDPNAKPSKQLNEEKQSANSTVRQITFQNGVQIQGVIEQVLKNSSYVTDQANVKINEKTGEQDKNQTEGKPTAWYNISLQAKPTKWDKKRNMYAYEFTWVISPYKTDDLKSSSFKDPASSANPQEQTIHKRYDYWFTGKNTEVLDLELKIDNSYVRYMTNSTGASDNADAMGVSDYSKRIFSPSNNQSAQGAAGKPNNIGASAADYLYDQSFAGEMQMSILGDPAWLLQEDLAVLNRAQLQNPGPFLPDGTISVSSGQVFYEILVGTPQDYNLQTGLMNPNDKPLLYPQFGNQPAAATQSFICTAIQCKSDFNRGKFTQTLKGRMTKYIADQTAKQAEREGIPSGYNPSSRSANNDANAQTNPVDTSTSNPNQATSPKNEGTSRAEAPKPPTSTGGIKVSPQTQKVLDQAGFQPPPQPFQRSAGILNNVFDGTPPLQVMNRES